MKIERIKKSFKVRDIRCRELASGIIACTPAGCKVADLFPTWNAAYNFYAKYGTKRNPIKGRDVSMMFQDTNP